MTKTIEMAGLECQACGYKDYAPLAHLIGYMGETRAEIVAQRGSLWSTACAECGYEGPTQRFRVVRVQRTADLDEWERDGG